LIAGWQGGSDDHTSTFEGLEFWPCHIHAVKGSGIRSGVRSANTYATSDYGWGGYDGYYGNRAVDSERRAIRAQERGSSALTSSQIADKIRAETSRVRRLMTERYKVEF
jgi:hypothetical protein